MNKFEELGLKDTVLKAITDLGFDTPSDIQEKSIPVVLEGHDMIGQAQTGTGKTAAFGCPIISKISKKDGLKALVLAPTRELAVQVREELLKLSKYEKLNIVSIYGGDSISRQIKDLNNNPNIVVGTPGRVIDMIGRKKLHLEDVNFLVLDEADEMLNMGFIGDIEEILKSLPSERQTLLFSATMPAPIKKLSKRYMKTDVKHIAIEKKSLTVSKIAQHYFETNEKNRFETLCRILDADNPHSAIIFCKTKRKVDEIVESMQSKGYIVEGMHGDMSQIQRLKTLKRFKDGTLNFLVATDVAARGIDVDGITHVINYELPQDSESYVHRIGRTGRANREGTAYSIISPREFSQIRQIKNATKSDITKKPIPTVDDILETRFKNLVTDISTTINKSDFEDCIPVAEDLMTKYETSKIIAALIKNQFNTNLSFEYTNNSLEEPKLKETRLFFSIGKRDGITAKMLVEYIQDRSKVKSSQITDVNLLENFSFVTVDESVSNNVLEKCSGNKLKKRRVNVEVANKKKR